MSDVEAYRYLSRYGAIKVVHDFYDAIPSPHYILSYLSLMPHALSRIISSWQQSDKKCKKHSLPIEIFFPGQRKIFP
jgi:uncharacterized membrane protein